MQNMRLIPPEDAPEEIARRLAIIDAQAQLNAILGINPGALAEAQACQRLRRRGQLLGPLHGVPLILKDNIACAGLPLTAGCQALAALRPAGDALVVRRLRAAGAIILARANMSEFAFDVRSRSSLGGDVLHPQFPAITAGGSSGGSAAAVAAGMAEGALGTDTGGSIRIPCSYTGLVGLRPGVRRAQMEGIAPLSLSKDTVGPMVHSVQDAALLHAIIQGQSPAALESRSLQGVHLGVIGALEGQDPQQGEVWQAALSRLARSGATLVEIDLPILGEIEVATCLSLCEFRVGFDAWLKQHPGAPRDLRAIVASGQFLPEFLPLLTQMLACDTLKTPAWLAGRQLRRRLRQALAQRAEHERIDGFLYPTVSRIPDSLEKMPPGCAPELAAISGFAAITLPCGRTRSGFPVGLEILSPAADEAPLLALAAACENAFTRP
ncbi:amidase family protein [Leclercia adecarboxylata]|uniref:amidase family protein n=1 Tax=Leclercia adecarboxylata TaxID=83655 RepID=UPI002DB6552B|nr:amidase family protein [Leclercia adecarboxylata]MEB6377402.1 amidase family protein [Leclercia adecarboxylata]